MSTEQRKDHFERCFHKEGSYTLILKSSGVKIPVSKRSEMWKDKFSPPNYWVTFTVRPTTEYERSSPPRTIDVRANEIGAIFGPKENECT